MMVNVGDTVLREDSPDETYIGDGVYASFDGEYIWLRAPHSTHDERIALEHDVFFNLQKYATTVFPSSDT